LNARWAQDARGIRFLACFQGSEVNAIDKLLAREEAHRVIHYRLRLKQIDQALRKQNPFVDPYDMPAEEYVQLYEAMAASRQGNNSTLAGITQSTITSPTSSLCCADTPSRPLLPIRHALKERGRLNQLARARASPPE
jgi:hypothetical protein